MKDTTSWHDWQTGVVLQAPLLFLDTYFTKNASRVISPVQTPRNKILRGDRLACPPVPVGRAWNNNKSQNNKNHLQHETKPGPGPYLSTSKLALLQPFRTSGASKRTWSTSHAMQNSSGGSRVLAGRCNGSISAAFAA